MEMMLIFWMCLKVGLDLVASIGLGDEVVFCLERWLFGGGMLLKIQVTRSECHYSDYDVCIASIIED